MRKELVPVLALWSLLISSPASAQFSMDMLDILDHNRIREAERRRQCFDEYDNRRPSLDPFGRSLEGRDCSETPLHEWPDLSEQPETEIYRDFTIVNGSDFDIIWLEVREYNDSNYVENIMTTNIDPPLPAGASATIRLNAFRCTHAFDVRTNSTEVGQTLLLDTCTSEPLVLTTVAPPTLQLTDEQIQEMRAHTARMRRECAQYPGLHHPGECSGYGIR